METRIYNIDSSINRVNGECSNNFTYTIYTISYINKIDPITGKTIKLPVINIEPFNEKNVYEVNILSFEFDEIFDILKSELEPIIYPPICNCNKFDPFRQHDLGNDCIPIIIPVEPNNTGEILEENIDIVRPILYPITYLPIEDIISCKTSTYFFLRINDLGNITNFNKKNGNIKYVAKIVVERLAITNQYTYKIVTNPIRLDQPMDIKTLKISLENKDGDLLGVVRGIDGIVVDCTRNRNYSFTLELKIITNSILKDYKQIKFYSEPVMERLLQSKMLAYFEKQVDPMTNNTLTNNYMSNLINLNNEEEYNSIGNRNNYINPNSSSLFTNMDKRL